VRVGLSYDPLRLSPCSLDLYEKTAIANEFYNRLFNSTKGLEITTVEIIATHPPPINNTKNHT